MALLTAIAITKTRSRRWVFLVLTGLIFISMSGEFPVEIAGSLTRAPEPAPEPASAQMHFDYDSVGNLRGVLLPNGTKIEYVLDGANRRIGKKVNGTLVQRFLYDGRLQIAAELDGEGQLVSRFVFGVRRHVPDLLVRDGRQFRLIADHLGSVRLVVDCQSGEVAQRLDYDEFGVVMQDTNPGFQPFGFAGGLYDRHTRLTRFGARDYEAETGRWTSRDPILFAAGQANLYAYVLNDPVNAFDPHGLQAGESDATPLSPAAQQAIDVINERNKTRTPAVVKALRRLNPFPPGPPVHRPEWGSREWAGEPSSRPIYCPRPPDRPPLAPGDFYVGDERDELEAHWGQPAPEFNETNFPTADIKVEAEEKADTATAIRG